MMRKDFASVPVAAVILAIFGPSTPAIATTVIVDNLGSINESSISLPSTKTPGSGGSFTYYYEFTIPKSEYISASMSISGPTIDQISTGSFVLADWTSTVAGAPTGPTIEQSPISAPAAGGQGAFLGIASLMGDLEPAGNYYVEISGVSGGGSLRLAVDGNVTATAPEPATWALMALGFAGLGFAGYRKRRTDRLAEALA